MTGAVAGATSFVMEATPLGRLPGEGGVIARTAIAAIAGGTASVLSGGKFTNGALMGAMAHLFNYEAHRGQPGTQSGRAVNFAEDAIEASNVLEGTALFFAPFVRAGVAVGELLGFGWASLDIQFAQRGVSALFRNGEFAGQSISEVAAGLRNGSIAADQLSIQVVVRDGVTYTMNNRSLMALREAGISPTVIRDVTGNRFFENQLTSRLGEMGGSVPRGFVPRIRGGG